VSVASHQAARIAVSILIVEDEGIIAHYIDSALRRAGHGVAGIAASSDEVFANVRECRPDLILMDIHIDGPMDGIQTAAQLMETSDIPIIYLSAYTDRLTLERAKATGASDFLSKPINALKLLTAVDGAIEKHRAAGSR
jgi:CheY-like chemotaxis protein